MDSKKNLAAPISLDAIADSATHRSELLAKLEYREIVRLIDKYLPVEFRADYLRMREGITVPKPRKDRIEEAILELMEDYL